MLIACMASFALVSFLGFFHLTEYETSRLRQKYYDDAGHISQIVRDQIFEVYRDFEDATLFISQLANELSRIEEVRHIEVYDRFGRMITMTSMDVRRPDDYRLHAEYAKNVITNGKTLSMEHIPEGLYEIIFPIFMAGDEHGGKPIGAVTMGMNYRGRTAQVEAKAAMLSDIVQLVMGKSTSHLEIERYSVDSITRRLGKIQGLKSLTVYDDKMKILAHSKPGHIGNDANKKVTNRLISIITTHEELEVEDIDKGEMIKYVPIIAMDDNGNDYVTAIVEMSLDIGYIEDTVALMRSNMFKVALAIVAVTMIAIWVVLRVVIVRPVRIFSRVTDAVGAGELDVKVRMETDDELGELADSFNRMTDELKRSRDELLAARNFNEDVLESLYESLIVTSSDGVVFMANAAAGELLGYSFKDMEHMKLENFLVGADEVLSEAGERGIAVFSEKEFIRADGSRIPVSLSATQMSSQSLGLVVIVATDISERKRAEQEMRQYTRKLEQYTEELVSADIKMRESEERFRLAFETAPDPIVLVRLRDGKYIDVNTGFVDLTGYDRHTVIEKSTFEDVSLWFDHDERNSFIGRVRRDGSLRNISARVVLKNRSILECVVSASIFDLSGEPHLLALFRDVSDLKKAQRDRDALTEMLMDKNRELEQLVYVSSHDLRSPLVNVQGFSKEIEMDLGTLSGLLKDLQMSGEMRDRIDRILEVDVPESLGYISTSVGNMSTLLRGLLKLSRLGRAEVHIKRLDMNSLVGDVIKNFSFRIKESDAKVEVLDLPDAMGDEGLVSQAVSNIVDNALKYMDDSRRRILSISGRTERGRSIYCIRDNGKGIRKEYQEKIFEIFHRLDPDADEGEGLGLSIVLKAVSKCGGKVWLESEEGKGSRFYIALPSPAEQADSRE